MKKTIGKPENWQDFESLCKKLWGEIWGIPNKIKKNGRLGQEQSGVDVYGKPKGESDYWGIQAKGKDDYTNAKLSEKEIVKEIEKAKRFKPALSVFIIATTANKDSSIEEFIRLKDIENQEAGLFEILLYCWEDIVDMLEDNANVLTWYLHEIGQKGKYDFRISFNEFKDTLTLYPVFDKLISRYRLTDNSDFVLLHSRLSNCIPELLSINPLFPFQSNIINESWCSFELVMENTGLVVIEDWRLILKFKSGVYKLDTGSFLLSGISLTEIIDDENKTITYSPFNNKPLIQKDNCFFKVSLLPKTDSDKIIVEWELLARDFNRKNQFQISIQPIYIEKLTFVDVNKESDLLKDEIDISYHYVESISSKKK